MRGAETLFIMAAVVFVVLAVLVACYKCLLTSGHASNHSPQNILEGFQTIKETALTWLHQGILKLGRVKTLQMPTQLQSKVVIKTVPIQESSVWTQMLAPERDGILKLHASDSVSELTVNAAHPYASFFTDYTVHRSRLSALGRRQTANIFPHTLDTFPDQAFDHVEFRGGARIFTLGQSFQSDFRAIQAVYDMLFIVAMLRACVLNGTMIDGILQAVSDHEEIARRNQQAMSKLQSEAQSDMKDVVDDNLKVLKGTKFQFEQDIQTAAANVAMLEKENAARTETSSHLTGEKAGLSTQLTRQANDLSTTSSDLLKTRAMLADLDYERSYTHDELTKTQDQYGSELKEFTSQKQTLDEATGRSEFDATRKGASQSRRAQELADAKKHLDNMLGSLDQAQKANSKVAASVEVAEQTLKSGRDDVQGLAQDLTRNSEGAQKSGMKLAELDAQNRRIYMSSQALKSQAESELERAMKTNKDVDNSYALWDQYASLGRLQDELDASDNGLPSA